MTHPAVTVRDLLEDVAFFDRHPQRHFWARQAADGWILVVRRGGDFHAPVFLRTWIRGVPFADNEKGCENLWERAAYPGRHPML